MPHLHNTILAWKSADFERILTRELTDLGIDHLPLQQGLASSSVALVDQLKLTLLDSKNTNDHAILKLGAFYTGIDAGCSCSDDPTPIQQTSEYCEFEVSLNLHTAEATITLLS